MSTIKQGITDLIEAKQALEARLQAMIAGELIAFQDLTGAAVDGVTIGIYTVERLSAPTQFYVSSVRVSVPLD